MNIALVQMSMLDDTGRNTAKASDYVRSAARQGAKIVCLPELFTTRYFPQEPKRDFSHLAQTVPGPTTESLAALAKELRIVLVAGSIFERAGKCFYNTSVIISETGALLSTYRKTHIPHDPCFYEQDYFSPGDTGYVVASTSYGRIAALICYDQWYPEAARSLALQGVDIIFYPTAIGVVDGFEQHEGDWCDAWTTVQRGHAIANCIFVAATNRVGREGKMKFWGSSFIAGPFGAILAKGDHREGIVIADCDLSEGKRIAEEWRFFHNRRPETYELLCRRQKN